MFSALYGRMWRGAVGMTVAYALVLQAMLAYGIAAQAAAQGTGHGSFFVVCLTGDDAAADKASGPAKPNTHCPICTLSDAGAALVPGLPVAQAWQPAQASVTPFVTAQACISFHQARAGLSRAPPQNV